MIQKKKFKRKVSKEKLPKRKEKINVIFTNLKN